MQKHVPIISAFIELTSKCNWRCKFCYAECNSYTGLDKMTIKRLIDELYDIGTVDITFTGGEPLMRKDAFEIFEYAKSKGFALSLYSNGSLINKTNVDKICSLFGAVDISIHSSIPEVHDNIVCSKGAWTKSIDAIKLLKSKGCKVTMKTVITRFTFDELDKLISLAEDQFDVEMNFETTIMDTYSRDNQGKKDFSLTSSQLAKLKKNHPIHYYGFDVNKAIYSKKKFSNICRATSETMFIDSYGNVFPCLLFKKNDMNLLDGKIWIESIKQKSLQEIWNDNPMFKVLRKLQDDNFTKCMKCEMNNLCHKCIAINYIETGSLTSPADDMCKEKCMKFSYFIQNNNIDY